MADTPESLEDVAWRKHVTEQFEMLNRRILERDRALAEQARMLKRIEANTRLARSIQDISRATGVIYKVFTCAVNWLAAFLKMLLKVSSVVLIFSVVVSMLLHGGTFPEWAKPWLILIRKE